MPDNQPIGIFQPQQRLGAGDLNGIGSFVNETGKEFNERDRLPDQRLQQVNSGNVLISAAETGKGKYTAKLLPYTTICTDPTADIASTDIGTVGENVLALNPGEIGGVSSPIDVSSGAVYAYGELQDCTATDGRRVVVILGISSGGTIKQVRLKNPSGDPGSLGALPNLVYDVYEMDNTTLIGSAVGMLNAPGGGVRIVKAPIFPGNYGILGTNEGTPVLLYANETYESDTCSTASASLSLAFAF